MPCTVKGKPLKRHLQGALWHYGGSLCSHLCFWRLSLGNAWHRDNPRLWLLILVCSHQNIWYHPLFTYSECVDTFTENLNKNANGATQQKNISTLTDCRAACLAVNITQCAAYEFDTRDNSCWIHGTAPKSLKAFNGVNHYTRVEAVNCSSSGESNFNSILTFSAECIWWKVIKNCHPQNLYKPSPLTTHLCNYA